MQPRTRPSAAFDNHGLSNTSVRRRLARFLSVACAAHAGCISPLAETRPPPVEPGPPPDAGSDAGPPPVIGPAPLRRLSNSQYLNALHDLFPAERSTTLLALPPLPNDTLVAGFDNAAEVQEPSEVRIARYETIANRLAESATRDPAALGALLGCQDWSTPDAAGLCASGFIRTTGSRIFRRPLTDPEVGRLEQRFAAWQEALDFEAAARLTLSALLQDPRFLYRAEPPPPAGENETAGANALEPYAMASRLSFLLWESVPDDELLAAAAGDELRTEAQISAQADRMLRDDRARRVFWSFHRQWLGLDRVLDEEHLVRVPDIDSSWTGASQVAALLESRRFVENILLASGSFRDLLTSPRAWLDPETARIYGVAAPQAGGEVSLPGDQRAGILTRLAFLAGYSHRGATSPPIRGNTLQLRLLCQPPQPPPPDADLSLPVPDLDSGPQTNRMLYEARTSPDACRACHLSLNGLGFGLENYTASGGYQTTDHGLPVDASGEIHRTDVDQTYDGGVALSRILSRSRVVHACATRQWVRYALGRAPVDAELPMLDALTDRFVATEGNVRALLMDLVSEPTFRMRRAGE
jgi:hypothetical protein